MSIDNVRATWGQWNTPFEARAPFMYIDIYGYVTGAIGILLENKATHRPTAEVFTMPWLVRSTSSRATHAEIDDEWSRVKARQDLKDSSLERRKAITTLYLAEVDVDKLTLKKFDEFLAILRIEFPDFDALPEAAQRGIMSMAWARGPYNFRHGFPRFYEAVKQRDWKVAAIECKIAGEATNKGLIPRNAANKALFESLLVSPAKTSVIPTVTPTAPSLWTRFKNLWS